MHIKYEVFKNFEPSCKGIFAEMRSELGVTGPVKDSSVDRTSLRGLSPIHVTHRPNLFAGFEPSSRYSSWTRNTSLALYCLSLPWTEKRNTLAVVWLHVRLNLKNADSLLQEATSQISNIEHFVEQHQDTRVIRRENRNSICYLSSFQIQ